MRVDAALIRRLAGTAETQPEAPAACSLTSGLAPTPDPASRGWLLPIAEERSERLCRPASPQAPAGWSEAIQQGLRMAEG